MCGFIFGAQSSLISAHHCESLPHPLNDAFFPDIPTSPQLAVYYSVCSHFWMNYPLLCLPVIVVASSSSHVTGGGKKNNLSSVKGWTAYSNQDYFQKAAIEFVFLNQQDLCNAICCCDFLNKALEVFFQNSGTGGQLHSVGRPAPMPLELQQCAHEGWSVGDCRWPFALEARAAAREGHRNATVNCVSGQVRIWSDPFNQYLIWFVSCKGLRK